MKGVTLVNQRENVQYIVCTSLKIGSNVYQTQYRLHNVHDSRLLHSPVRVENL